MLELTPDNVIRYLRERGWIGEEHATADLLSGGVSNQVLRVTTPVGPVVVKQSRPQLRTRDAWFSDLDRIHREQEVMQALHPHLPDVVPNVLNVDKENFVYTMTHAPLDAVMWKAELLASRIDVSLGKRIGETLGKIHQVSADRRAEFAGFADRVVYVQLRVDPFYRRVQERRPEVAHAVAPMIDEMMTRQDALCHGDYTPKNILVDANGFTLVDYETAHLGDPTMDLGLFLAHLTLKAVRAPDRLAEFLALIRAFWVGYCERVSFDSHAVLECRGVRHLGVCLLARVDGTSPVDYLPGDAQRDLVRQLGRAILLDGIERWEDVWAWCSRQLTALPPAPAPG